MPTRHSTRRLADIYPHLMCTEVMSAAQFEKSFALFLAAYARDARLNDIMIREVLLGSIVISDIAFDAKQDAPRISELATGLERIGAAMIMLIQLEAIRDGLTFINAERLGAFIARFSPVRRFVQLDYNGLDYAIVA